MARYAWNTMQVRVPVDAGGRRLVDPGGLCALTDPVARARGRVRARALDDDAAQPRHDRAALHHLRTRLDRHGVLGSLKPLIVPSFFGDAFSVFLLRQFFLAIPEELADAARVDGAGEFRGAAPGDRSPREAGDRGGRRCSISCTCGTTSSNRSCTWGRTRARTLVARPRGVPRAASRGLEPHDGRLVIFMMPGHPALLARTARLHRGGDGHRRQGLSCARACSVALFGCGWIQDFHARGVLESGARARRGAPTTGRSARRVRREVRHPAGDDRLEGGAPTRDRRGRVGTPNALHAPQAIALPGGGQARAGREADGESVAECEAMIAASERCGAWLMVAHCWRFHDEVHRAPRPDRGRRAGRDRQDPRLRHARRVGTVGVVRRPALAGGGALADMGVHAIDTARFLLGDPEPAARVRDGRHPVRRLRGRRRRDPADHLVQRHEQGGRVRLVASPQGRDGGRHRGLRHGGYARIGISPRARTGYEHCAQTDVFGADPSSWTGARAEGSRGRAARTAPWSCGWSTRRTGRQREGDAGRGDRRRRLEEALRPRRAERRRRPDPRPTAASRTR